MKLTLTLILLMLVMGASGKCCNACKCCPVEAVANSQSWYNEPWVWIVGGAMLFILLFGAILGSTNHKQLTNFIISKDMENESRTS